MKPKFMKVVALSTILIFLFSVNLFAQRNVKTTGIGFRGSYWKLSNEPMQIKVTDHYQHTSVNTGSGGGWLFLLSRLNYTMLFELSVGGVGKVEEEIVYYTDRDVDVFAVTPILFGLRMEITSPESQVAFKPYLSLGAGPYWISNIRVKERMFEEEVTVETKFNRGGYLGGGVNFLLSDWFAINFDVKYHFIEFNVNHENSGYEYGLGFCFMWGNYKR